MIFSDAQGIWVWFVKNISFWVPEYVYGVDTLTPCLLVYTHYAYEIYGM